MISDGSEITCPLARLAEPLHQPNQQGPRQAGDAHPADPLGARAQGKDERHDASDFDTKTQDKVLAAKA